MGLIRRGIHFGSYGSVDDGAAVFTRLAESADLSALGASLRALVAAGADGADGVMVAGVTDPAAVGPVGRVLSEVLPD